ncbi:MAG: RnfABCDGE type electron transport complex subunit B [Clostridia bacterium]
MNFLNILYAVLILGALGLVLGGLLAFASRVFAVDRDDRYDKVTELLPGANCGGCGYAGCANYAAALVDGEAALSACPVSNESAMGSIAKILGIELTKNERLQALVRCNGGTRTKRKFDYVGISDCAAANRVAGGDLECSYGCLGFGSCAKACAFDAISIKNGVAVVDGERCTGCLQCVSACPRGIIVPVPYTADVNVICSNHDSGAALRGMCEIGCIGCKICVKACKYGAITVEDNLARIDYSKCTGCGECALKCPRGLIINSKLMEPPVAVSENVSYTNN